VNQVLADDVLPDDVFQRVVEVAETTARGPAEEEMMFAVVKETDPVSLFARQREVKARGMRVGFFQMLAEGR
jgi:hypothetical protein